MSKSNISLKVITQNYPQKKCDIYSYTQGYPHYPHTFRGDFGEYVDNSNIRKNGKN